jgi:TRAP-type mannitol/chloroaromatic compound transport system substrate-binding protein
MTRRRTFIAAGAGAALAAPATLRAETPRRWRMVTSWPRGLPGPGTSAERLARRIEALSDGRIAIQVHGAGELVPAFEVLDAVGGGQAELGHTAAVFWAGKMPAAPFFLAVPMGLVPHEHVAWIEAGGGQSLWDALYAPFGVKPFLAGNTGMSMGGWFKREVTGPADLAGLRFAMPGLGGEMWRPLGILQVSIPPGERLPALQSGAIDAAEFAGPFSDLALGFHRAASFYYWPGLHEPNGAGECLINRALFAALPVDLRAIVAEACRAEHALALAESERMNAAALDALVREHGVQLRRFPAVIEAAAREAAAGILGRFETMGGIEAEIARSYRAMLEGQRGWSSVSVRAFLEARGREA